MNGLSAEKSRLRRQLLEKREGLSAAYLAASTAAIAARLQQLQVWHRAQTIFCYVGVGAEPGTRGLIEAALAGAKRVCVPRCEGAGIMHACQINSLAELRPAAFGLLEPETAGQRVPPGRLDLVVAPCLAAAKDGWRLGNGGGYYDRYLPQVSCPVVCLCHGALLMESLPHGPQDVPVDGVITGDGQYGNMPFPEK